MTTCSKYSTSVTLEAAQVFFGKEVGICIEPTTVIADGQSLIVANGAVIYQVWFNVDGGGAAPTPAAGETLIEVAVTTGDTLLTISEAIKTSLETHFEVYIPKEDGSQVILESFFPIKALRVSADVDTGWTIHQLQEGFELDLGETASAIEFSVETNLLDVSANQSGPLILTQIQQAGGGSVSLDLQNISQERLKTLIAEGFGDSYTPQGGTELIGYGTGKIGTNALELAGRLRLHPLRLDASDKSQDLNLWKTVPALQSTNYSGTDVRVLNVDFVAYRDEFKPEEINVWAFGDGNQDL